MAECGKGNKLVFFGSDTVRLELSSIQKQVFEILSTRKSQKYSLGDWYLGAIYAAKNIHNPDRFSQAAQSLRELLEKLPRVFVESEIQESRPDFRCMRDDLYSQLCSDKNRYEGEWKGKIIDAKLNTTIKGVYNYFKLSKTPTRKEQIHFAMSKIDPLNDAFDQKIKKEKSERFHSVWQYFEELAHHKGKPNEETFWQKLKLVEDVVVDLLAPITAQDQGAIRAILEKPQPELRDVENMLELIKRRGANYVYFFKTADNPAWINPLSKNGFLKNLPGVEATGDDRIIIPLWWPIFYLQRVAKQNPEQVVKIILGLEKTDNPRILREIFSIACDLKDMMLSLRLKPLIMQFIKLPYQWGEEELIVKILKKWGSDQEPSRNAALEIIQYTVAFQPDPKKDEKQALRKDNPEVWDTSLEPVPRFGKWEYRQILENGVRPLAERQPYQVSRILIDAVASMIRLGMHEEDFGKDSDYDYSQIWCRRLDKPDRDYQNVKETLVRTLTYACEQVYENAPESIDALDQALRNHRWKMFKRLRQHLYALHPNDQTLPWIREQILGHDDYPKWEYPHELQLMIRKACEHFGARLLSEEERNEIFEAILNGPSKEDSREWMGEGYSEEAFQKRQRHFHRMQLRPFAALLSGDALRYFHELENESSADSYLHYAEVRSGWVSQKSPKAVKELERFTDEELLTYLNDWNEKYRDKDDWLVEINIAALASVFQSLFKDKIVPDGKRLDFWLVNRDRIARPVYVEAMLMAMLELVKEKSFDKLDQWFDFCAWVLSHPDTGREEGHPAPSDESRDHPDWGSSRRVVVDFIDACVNKDTAAPITARKGLAHLLRKVCCQPDWRLDHDRPMLLNRRDPLSEAINNTRSRALRALVNFGIWIRQHLSEDQVPEVTDILAKRLAMNAKPPLTLPEQALLGARFGDLCILNQGWATQQRTVVFPQANKAVWWGAFDSYICLNLPSKLIFEILQDEFDYAIENLKFLVNEKDDGKHLIDKLGQHLFIYYLWEIYPLTGDESLLERFYDKTEDGRKRWANLFDYVGRLLSNSGSHLDNKLTGRIIAFFNWRLEAAEPLELQKFTLWLEAECLDSCWRLQSYLKILDLGLEKNSELWQEVKALNELLPDHLELVVKCFAKIMDAMDQDTQMYISANKTKPILKAGLAAKDPEVRGNAERARENLLKLGRFDYLDVE